MAYTSLAFTIMLWVSGVILFANTDMGVVYDPVLTYNATAGVGEFNGSYVREYIGNLQDREAEYPYTVVPYWMQAIVNNLVTSPMHSAASVYTSVLGGGWDNTCRLGDAEFYPNLTTTFTVFSRKTTFITARSNMSILSVTSAGQPTQISTLDLDNFRTAIDWILNFDGANIPSPTSIAQQFWSAQGQLGNAYWSPILLQTFHSIITFPFWFFNANNLGNMEGYGTGITPNLPQEFYITASISVPHNKIIISTAMFSIFIIFQAIMHLFIWSVFAWLCIQRPPLPVITSYPLFNFAFKAYDKRGSLVGRRDQGCQTVSHRVPPADVLGASDGDVLNILQHSIHALRSDNKILHPTNNKIQQQIQSSSRLATW
ncbi:hypothetical protein BDW72DRAFT_199769 [Aspergillus terricola var. indicus]